MQYHRPNKTDKIHFLSLLSVLDQCRVPLVRLAERVVTKANHDKEIRLDWDVRGFGDRQHAPNVVGRRRDLIFWSSALTGGRRHWNLGWLPYGAGDLVCLTTASGLLPADYCQLELPFDVQRTPNGVGLDLEIRYLATASYKGARNCSSPPKA